MHIRGIAASNSVVLDVFIVGRISRRHDHLLLAAATDHRLLLDQAEHHPLHVGAFLPVVRRNRLDVLRRSGKGRASRLDSGVANGFRAARVRRRRRRLDERCRRLLTGFQFVPGRRAKENILDQIALAMANWYKVLGNAKGWYVGYRGIRRYLVNVPWRRGGGKTYVGYGHDRVHLPTPCWTIGSTC